MNEPEVSQEPAAPSDPGASTPTPPPDTEPFFGTLRRVCRIDGRDRRAYRESDGRLGCLKQGESDE
jgi:hypothetical protein